MDDIMMQLDMAQQEQNLATYEFVEAQIALLLSQYKERDGGA